MINVAIIGGGPAGLASAKECLAQGLEVTLFEKSSHLGGLWNADTGSVWEGMKTNLSRDTCRFPDFGYQRPVDLFPSQQDILDYLQDYTDHFDLSERANIQLNSEVQEAFRGQNGWQVKVGGESHSFDAVIVASGFFSKRFVPQVMGKSKFQGTTEHSSDIQSFEFYKGRTVDVIGNGFSGCDIAVGLANAGANVTHQFRRPYWIIPREHEGQAVDALFYQYPDGTEVKSPDLLSQFRETNRTLAELFVHQAKYQLLHIDPDSTQPPHVAITDGYLDAVENGSIKLSQVENVNLHGNKADHIIFATGFETNLSFLSDDVLNTLEYAPSDQFMPALLDKSGQHPDLSNMVFVGMYRGPYFLTMALQAQIAARTIAGENIISKNDMRLGIEEARDLRAEVPQRQFPYGDYAQFSLDLACELGIELPKEGRVLPKHFAERKL